MKIGYHQKIINVYTACLQICSRFCLQVWFLTLRSYNRIRIWGRNFWRCTVLPQLCWHQRYIVQTQSWVACASSVRTVVTHPGLHRSAMAQLCSRDCSPCLLYTGANEIHFWKWHNFLHPEGLFPVQLSDFQWSWEVLGSPCPGTLLAERGIF